jgi:DNA (cytosine-5)-methyltransferase 1
MELSVLDLFSGIGGFSVGLESTGKFKTVAFCEQDKFCQKVLHKHWPNIPIHEDIKKLDARKIKADVLVGGFPCQSFSIAGKQKGKDDERYLWDEMFRVIKEVKPRWIIGENVQNLTNISNGEILQGIYNDLESQSYEVQTFNISASSQGAWHKRSRIWIVANSKHYGPYRQKRNETIKSSNEQEKRLSVRDDQDVSNTNSRLSVRENEEVQARRDATNSICKSRKQTWWQTQSKLCGVPNGVSYELDKDRKNRIKALGNTIVPQIVTEIGQAIIKAEEEINEWN